MPSTTDATLDAVVITPEEELASLRGTFESGHTDDDACEVLGAVLRLTGRRFAVLWAYKDCWGPGGDSQLVEVDAEGQLRDAPAAWCSYLYQPESTTTAAELAAADLACCIYGWEKALQASSFNYYWEFVDGEA